jgi:23S rRNA (cytosine1962-C5)-methyltransferase
MSQALPAVHLRPRAHTRLARGHRWIFSNEIERTEGDPAPGTDVRILDGAGKTRGTGTYNPHTLIAVRLHSRGVEPLDEGLIRRRVQRAFECRRSLYPDRSCWRAVFSEADGLPGLIVDRLGDVAVVQILTLAMESRRPAAVRAIEEVLAPRAILEKSDSPLRGLESLPARIEVLRGEVGETIRVEDPPGIPLEVPLATGQKTGLFLDHHDNRLLLMGRVDDKRVLDVFCYIGQWSCCAAAWGASSVLGIDASGEAIARAEANAALGKVGERCRFRQGDAFEELRALERGRESYDVIVLDPPAFAKSRRQVRDALRGYKEVNVRAMRLLARGGRLVTACCSHHVGEGDFREMLIKAARNAGREFLLEAPLRQAADHPVLLGHPETSYLKGALLRRIQ